MGMQDSSNVSCDHHGKKIRRPEIIRAVLRLGVLLPMAAGMLLAQATPSGTAAAEGATPTSGESAPAAKLSVKVDVVNVFATVRDKHGKIVQDLTPDDFVLSEDGRPQKIRYFRKDTDLPLTLGLLVDTSVSQRAALDEERTASRSFLDQMVRENQDRAFLIHFDREAELLQDLTSSHEKLEAALSDLQTPQLKRADSSGAPDTDPDAPGSGRRGGQHAHWGGGGTVLYDSVYLAADELMSKQQGRKALVVLSDGVDRGSKESIESSIAAAQRANTVVYAIYFKGEEGGGDHQRGGFGRHGGWGGGMGGPGMGGGGMGRPGGGQRYPRQEERVDGKKILERISAETGGQMFEVSKKQPVDQIYTQIAEDLRNQYNIGYTPDRGGAAAAGYHKIQLTTVKKNMTVQARAGYYGSE
jgi:VWFA-related protein